MKDCGNTVARCNRYVNIVSMTQNSGGTSPHTHFARQMLKERLARNWSLREMSARTGLAFSYLSQIENGKVPPSERVAKKCDEVFPEREGYFVEYYEESKSWMPAGFRDWAEIENAARELIIWIPNVVDATAQTPDYARAQLSIHPGATKEVLAARLKSRLARQTWLLREDGPAIVLLVDQVALYRGTGSAEIMAGQCARLLEVAALETVTLQVVPIVNHPLATASAIITGQAAYTENGLGGAVHTGEERVARLRSMVAMVRSEAYRASESLVMIQEAGKRWTSARAAIATADRRVSRPRATREPS